MSAPPLVGSPPAQRLPTNLRVRPGIVAALGLGAAIAVGFLLAAEPRMGVAVLLAVVYVPIVLLNLPLAVVIWVPTAFINAVPLVSLASIAMLALIAVAWAAVAPGRRAALRAFGRRNAMMLWALLLLTSWVTASIMWSTDPGAAGANVLNWFFAAAGFLIVATTVTQARHLVALIVALIVGAVLAAAVGFAPIGDASPTVRQDGRIAGGLGDPNYLAAGIVVALSLTAGLAVATRRLGLRWALIGVAGFLLISLAATGSRGGLIAAAISIVAALLLIRSSRIRFGVVVATALAVTGLWLVSNSSGTWDRIREFDTRGTGRVDLWDIAWRMSGDHPLIGVGVNNFRANSDDYVRQPGAPEDIELITERPHVVHDIYLQQLAETGIIGLSLLLTVIGAALTTTWKAIRRLESTALRLAVLARSVLVAQIGALSASLLLSNAYDPLLWILLALSPVLGTVALRTEQSEKQSEMRVPA